MRHKNKTSNKWKAAFFTLAASLLLLFAATVIWLMATLSSSGGDGFQPPSVRDAEGASFTITTGRDDLNYWLQSELNEETGADMFDLYIEDAIYMETVLEAFGIRIPVEMTLSPHVTSDGNLELREESFTIGNISLPSNTVFQLIEARADLPEWIIVAPEERLFYMNLRDGISEEMDIRIEAFDLGSDEFVFEVTMPN